MTKLKIVEPGWETYTGFLSSTEFVNGESVDHTSQREARRLAASIQIIDIETGKSPSTSQALLDMKDDPAPVATLVNEPASSEPSAPASPWTRESLEALADEKGIKGLREIGDQFDVKDTSVAGLIDKILAASQPKTETIEQAVENLPAGEGA